MVYKPKQYIFNPELRKILNEILERNKRKAEQSKKEFMKACADYEKLC